MGRTCAVLGQQLGANLANVLDGGRFVLRAGWCVASGLGRDANGAGRLVLAGRLRLLQSGAGPSWSTTSVRGSASTHRR